MNALEREFKVTAHDGIHLRPAQLLVEKAQEFEKAEIRILKGDQEADGKSILSVLSLGLDTGHCFRLEVKGEQAQACLEALEVVLHREKIA